VRDFLQGMLLLLKTLQFLTLWLSKMLSKLVPNFFFLINEKKKFFFFVFNKAYFNFIIIGFSAFGKNENFHSK